MKKWCCLFFLVSLLLYGVGLVRDLNELQNSLIRLHVVGASDDAEDQERKLQVKDAVNNFLLEALQEVETLPEAKLQLTNMLPQIKKIAESVLKEQGIEEQVSVTLAKEMFPKREYETFTLPAGVYESLRIRIGAAQGRNWWCVVFPSLCVPSETEYMRDQAVGAGFSEDLCATITGEEGYEIRFFFLDLLGQLQNLWFQGN